MPRGRTGVLRVVLGVLIGVATTTLLKAADTASEGRWQVIAGNGPGGFVWRLDTKTGHLESCWDDGRLIQCQVAPGPKASN